MAILYVSKAPAFEHEDILAVPTLEAALEQLENAYQAVFWDSRFDRGNVPWRNDREEQAARYGDIRELNGVDLAEKLYDRSMIKVCHAPQRQGFIRQLYERAGMPLQDLVLRPSSGYYLADNWRQLYLVANFVRL